MKQVYLDYGASTPVDPEVMESMAPYYTDVFANTSSLHSHGQKAKAAIENSRDSLAKLLGIKSHEIVFTSGGTESNNTAIKGTAFSKRSKGNHIITSKIEHHSVLETCIYLQKNGFDVTYIKPDSSGLIDPDDIQKAVKELVNKFE